MNSNYIERRASNDVELRADLETRKVSGYAIVFNSQSEDLGFIETIHEGAVTADTIAQSDVFARLNHEDNKVLARSKRGKGSLKLSIDNRGLYYEFIAPRTALGDELLEYLQRGDITASSFAFSLDPKDTEAEKWTNKDNTLFRDIYHINKLYDVAPVFSPAYEATSCSTRAAEVQSKCDELNGYFASLRDEINNI